MDLCFPAGNTLSSFSCAAQILCSKFFLGNTTNSSFQKGRMGEVPQAVVGCRRVQRQLWQGRVLAARDGHGRDEHPCRGEHPSRSKHPRTVGLHIMHRSVRAPQAAAGAEPCKTIAFQCTPPWSNPALSQSAVEMARGGNGRTRMALVPCG